MSCTTLIHFLSMFPSRKKSGNFSCSNIFGNENENNSGNVNRNFLSELSVISNEECKNRKRVHQFATCPGH